VPRRDSSFEPRPSVLSSNRREWLQQAALAGFGLALGGQGLAWADAPGPRAVPPQPSGAPRKKVAAVVTTYYIRSHAYHIVGRFLWGYQWQGRQHQPPFEVVSLYTDQVPGGDLSRGLAKRFGFRVSPTVADALTVGTENLAVDAVLLIGEHGNYPNNAKGQKLYPRYELFEQIDSVFAKAGRGVPVFNDKHLSYDIVKAKKMVATAHDRGFPLMAGSSLPVTWRRPELELPLGCHIEEALVAAYGGNDAYGFHGLETLQCMVERRAGGETGVKAITCLRGQDVWAAGDRGLWSWNLLEHALGRSETLNVGDIRVNVGNPFAILIEYQDGLRGAMLLLNEQVADFNFAAKLSGQQKPESCLFYLPAPPGANYFSSLVANIEKCFETGRSPYPVERTLLTSGMADLAFTSLAQKSQRVETPELEISYQPSSESTFARGSPASPVEA
jgi:hypothetical protein